MRKFGIWTGCATAVASPVTRFTGDGGAQPEVGRLIEFTTVGAVQELDNRPLSHRFSHVR